MERVVVAGHVNWDVTLRVDALPVPDGEARIRERTSAGGGSAGNVAVALARLQVPSGVVGSVGDDERGRDAAAEFDEAGVERSHLRVAADAPTSLKYLVVAPDGQVMVLGNDGANEAFEPSAGDETYVAAADHLHLTSQRPAAARVLASAAREAGVPVSFDPGRRLGARDFSAVFALADYVFMNDREAAAAGGAATRPEAVRVVKRGAAGAVVETPTGRVEHPGYDVEAVDTTGAGDAFAAGFIASLESGDDYETALARANACGALASTTVGARTVPTRAELRAFLSTRGEEVSA